MGVYRTAEVCPNGHVSTCSADAYPELREKYCSECGEATITQCPKCSATIRGKYYVEGVIRLVDDYEPPSFCFNCGNPFPWTERKIEATIELIQTDGNISDEELSQFRNDLGDLVKDSPKVQVASLRFKQTMSKVGSSVASGARDIIVDILSEAAKKAIWGN